jgi:DNA topoisomerase VI subunit B
VCLICQHSIPKKSKPSLEDSKEIEKEISKKTIQEPKEIKKENTKKINQNELKENSSFEKNTIPKVIQEPKEIKKEEHEVVDESISLEDWNCTNCRKRNKAQRKVCFLCLSPK